MSMTNNQIIIGVFETLKNAFTVLAFGGMFFMLCVYVITLYEQHKGKNKGKTNGQN